MYAGPAAATLYASKSRYLGSFINSIHIGHECPSVAAINHNNPRIATGVNRTSVTSSSSGLPDTFHRLRLRPCSQR